MCAGIHAEQLSTFRSLAFCSVATMNIYMYLQNGTSVLTLFRLQQLTVSTEGQMVNAIGNLFGFYTV